MEFKGYSKFAPKPSKNKLVRENAVTRAHGSCSLRFMGYALKLGFLETVQPNSYSKLIPAACNFKNNAQETYLFVSDL